MIRKKSKLLIILIIFIMTFNFFSPIVLAEPMSFNPEDVGEDGQLNDPNEYIDSPSLGQAIDFGSGLLLYPIKMLAYYIGQAINWVTKTVAGEDEKITPDTILFNQVELTKINFFDTTPSKHAFVNTLRENVATWYSVMRWIAIIASVCVLIYIAIRMAASTIASEKAEYKRMLTDWFVGFILIFVLHYIIVFVISLNNEIVAMLYKAMDSSNAGQISTFMTQLEKQVYGKVDFTQSIGSVTVFLIFVGITLAFLIMYIKRMIVLAFLIIIAPLITITYAIDKVGDSKSQALDAWVKEFVWTVLIQPFHCVIYVVFVSVAISGLNAHNLAGSVLAIMCMVFIMQAEDIIKKIFGIQADNIGKMSGSFALAAGGVMAASKIAGKGAGAAAKGAGVAANSLSKVMPKVTNGVGLGTGAPTGSKVTSFAQKFTNSTDKVQKGMKNFDKFMKENAAGRMLKSYVSTGYNMATGLTGAALSLPTSKGADNIINGALGGMAAGAAVKAGAKYVANKTMVQPIQAGRIKNAEMNLNDSIANLQAELKQNGGVELNSDEIVEKVKALLDLKLDKKTMDSLPSDAMRILAFNAHSLQQELEKAGKDSSIEAVLSKVHTEQYVGNERNNDGNSATV